MHVKEQYKGAEYCQLLSRLFERGSWSARNVHTWRPLLFDLAVQFRAAAEMLLR